MLRCGEVTELSLQAPMLESWNETNLYEQERVLVLVLVLLLPL